MRDGAEDLIPKLLRLLQGQWRFAPGLVPGEPNEGLVSQLEAVPCRLPDYDDSGWEVRHDLAKWHSHGLTFAWYRRKVRASTGMISSRSGTAIFKLAQT